MVIEGLEALNTLGPATQGDEDDDDISLTSTVSTVYDEEALWNVEEVLAEAMKDDGIIYHLIKWEDFPLDMATWEPRDALDQDLLDTWEDAKRQIEFGEKEPFDLSLFDQALAVKQAAKEERKERRSAKRERIRQKRNARIAQPLPESKRTGGPHSDAAFINAIRSESSDDSESDHDYIPDTPAQGSVAAPKASKKRLVEKEIHKSQQQPQNSRKEPSQQSTQKPRQKIFQLPDPTPINSTADSFEAKQRTTKAKPPSKSTGSGSRAVESKATATGHSEPASATGYKGTARKPSSGGKGVVASSAPASLKTTISSRTTGAPKLPADQPGRKPSTMKRSTAPPAKRPRSPVQDNFKNVFIDGKKRKPRAGLAQAVTDPTKGEVFFTKHRYQRKAELNERAKENREPNFAQIAPKLFSPRDGPLQRRTSLHSVITTPSASSPVSVSNDGSFKRTGGILKSSTQFPFSDDYPDTSNKRRKSAQGPFDSGGDDSNSYQLTEIDGNGSATSSTRTTKDELKRKKSVRFFDDVEGPVVHDPMEFDETRPLISEASNENSTPGHLSEAQQSAPSTAMQEETQRSINPTKKLSLADYRQSKGLVQVAQKQLYLGSTMTMPLAVLFNGLPRDTNPPWALAFSQEQSVHLKHTCFSTTFLAQWPSITQAVVCKGTITAKSVEDSAQLDLVAEHLRSTAAGLYQSHPRFNLLVYPTKSDEWRSEQLDADAHSPSEVALRYAIFTSTINCEIFMTSPNEGTASARASAEFDLPALRATLMSDTFGLDKHAYMRLFSPKEVQSKQHAFFLIFPGSKLDMLKQIGLWLRQHNPLCQIMTCREQGAWLSFCALAQHVAGVVIVHESFVGSIRRMPRLFELFSTTTTAMWLWSQEIEGISIPAPSRSLDPPIDPCHAQLGRLFPSGQHAILITPSFLVSEPKYTYELLKWYYNLTESARCRYKMVTSWGIGAYLEGLAMAKAQERDTLTNLQSSASVLQENIVANCRRISRDDCENRFKTWSVVAAMLDHRDVADPMLAYDESGPFIYADRSIDPNDEQSLVNWFGWWSTMRLNQFRYFHVVGSSTETQRIGREWAKHTVRIPEYTKATTSNPDSHIAPPNAMQSASTDQVATVMSPEERVTRLRRLRQTPSAYTKPLFGGHRDFSNTYWDLTNDLYKLPHTPFHRCYGFPVYWKQRDDSWTHDFKGIQKTTAEWYTFQFRFNPNQNFSSYTALFYTPMEDSDPASAVSNGQPARHAWVLTYRVANWKVKPWTSTEALIWDPAAPLLFPERREVREEDLPKDQQFVLQYIRDYQSEKNPHYPLQRVWYGGSHRTHHSRDLQSDLDIAMAFLNDVMADPHGELPLVDSAISAQGYCLLANSNKPAEESPVVMDANRTASDAGDSREIFDEKVIIHPPSGRLDTIGKSKCRNSLYECARLARMRNKDAQFMAYEYKPTKLWYEEQREEGRGFEHLNIDSWENILNYLKIGRNAAEGSSSGP